MGRSFERPPLGPNRWLEFLGALTFTIPLAAGLVLLTLWNPVAGGAAVTLAVTAALIFRPD